MIFYIVDVFAEKKYSGNQLAVCRVDRELPQEEMQAIARETNFAETTFVLSDQPRKGGFDVRIFTPRAELPFAGHPTLGTAFVIRREILQQPVDQVILNLGVGPIPVTFGRANSDPDILWMQQKPPEFGRTFERSRKARLLSLHESDFDSRCPIQEVSTGLPHVIVPLKDLAALKRARVAHDEYESLVSETGIKAVMVFCNGGYHSGHDLGVRMFAPGLGVAEDPATGSGNGCLAGYLVHHRYFGDEKLNIRTAQGYEINRPSLLFLNAEKNGDGINVSVGGKVIKVAQGKLV